MVKLIIFNTCLGFQLLGLNSVTIEQAKKIQHMAGTCRSKYKTCLKSVQYKNIDGGEHYNVLCK